MSVNKVYVAMVNERHSDIEPYVFTTAEAAIAFACNIAHEYASDEVEVIEEDLEGWLYCANWSAEGDSVWVVEKTLDADA